MSRQRLVLLAALLLGACATPGARLAPSTQPPGDWRTAPPAGGPPPALRAPVPERHVLANGLTVLLVHRPGLPLVHTTIMIRAGAAQDPADRPGLAGLLGELLRAGTTTRSAAEVAEAIETLGGSLEIDVDDDAMTVSTSVLEEHHAQAMALLADVVQRPALAADELERVRDERLAALAAALADPGYVAAATCRREIFGPHRYGHTPLGTAATIRAVNESELRAFVARYLRPSNSAVILVGSLPPAAARAAAEAHFGAWSDTGGTPPPLAAPVAQEPSLLVIDKPGAPQTQLCVAHLGVARRHPDYLRLMVANAILGGSFSSRINMNLREDKGYTYGARSHFEMLRAGGAFVVSTAVETAVTAPAVGEIVKELVTMREADVQREELTTAKNRYSLSLPGYFQTVRSVAAMVGNIYLHELPLDYYQTLPAAVDQIGLADVRRVAQEALRPEALHIVAVGDAAAISDALQALGRGAVRREALPVVDLAPEE